MSFLLKTQPVGPWPVNAYLVVCEETLKSAIVDPGAEVELLLQVAEGTSVEKILITHAHPDHIGVLNEIRSTTAAPVYLHPVEADAFDLKFDLPLQDGDEIVIGRSILTVRHAPGHTPGLCCFDLEDGRVLVGDSVFPGGPGKTWSAEDFNRQMQTMQEVIFAWPDETVFYPGHGLPGRIGEERPAFEAFLRKGWPEGLFGDVTWAG